MSASPADPSVNQLDELVHQRYRLGIMAFLSSVDRAEFTTLRTKLGLTDGNLNRHLLVLNEAGFVTTNKSSAGGARARTWVRLTETGRAALHAHVSTLRAMLDTIE